MNSMGKFIELTDDALIQLILTDSENKEAWEEFYNRFSGYLFAIIHHCISAYHVEKTSIDSHDIFHDVFLAFYEKVLRHNFEFRGSAQLRRYLQVIVNRKVIDIARNSLKHISIDAPTSQRVQDGELESALVSEMIPSEVPLPEEGAIRKERITLLKEAISRLSGKEKEVMELLLAGYEDSEIAYILDIKENYVDVIRYRARTKLKKMLIFL